MPPWPTLIVFAVLASCAAVVVVGYLRGNRTKHAPSSAGPADEAVTAVGPVQPAWDERAAHTDSWIWR